MREDTFSNDEHSAGRFERNRIADDYVRVGGRYLEPADIPARSDLVDE